MQRTPRKSGNASTSQDTPADGRGLRWTGRSRGGYWGNWIFVQLVRRFGVRWAYALLVPVAAYFTVASPRAYRCSRDFLRRAVGTRPFWCWPFLVYRHFLAHGITLLDRMAVIMGSGTMQCRYEGEDRLEKALEQGRGLLLLGSHLGNWEMGAHLLGRLGRPVNLVVLEREREQIRRLFGQALEGRGFTLLTTDEHPLRSVPIVAALRRGEIVALHGDRTLGSNDLAIPFLGDQARFPLGPYLLAAASGAPLFQVFAVRERLGAYRFFCHPPQYLDKTALRRNPQALKDAVTLYVERLGEVARQWPYQWHNFYPYWENSRC